MDAGALRFLGKIASAGTRIVRARSETDFLKALPDATVAITWHFSKEWYAVAKRLRVLATPAAGRELIAYAAAPKGVTVHFGGFHGKIMAESVAGFVLAWSHGFFLPELSAAAARPWCKSWPRVAIGGKCSLVAGTNAVIVGFGRVGRAIGDKLHSLGVRLQGFGRRNIAALPTSAKNADWLIMALPGDTGTNNLLNAELISKLPKKCVVVNVGRGNSVDEEALLDALETGRIAGAYLDVFKGEPGPLSRRGVARKGRGILGRDPSTLPANLVMMPHSSAFCGEYLRLCFRELKDEGLV